MSEQIFLPNGWDEVSIFQYQEIAELPDNEHRTNAIIAILADADIELIERQNVEVRSKMLELIEWSGKLPDSKNYRREIELEGVKFYLQDFNELLIGERIDLKNYCKDADKNFHRIMSILYKPEKPVKNVEDLIQDKMMIADVYGALVFFCLIATKSLEILQDSLTGQMSETMTTKSSEANLLKTESNV